MDSSLQNSFKIIGFVTALILVLLAFWFYSNFFLLLFGGILWGVALSGLARLIAGHLSVPYWVSLTFSLLLLLATVLLLGWQIGPKVVSGLQELQEMIPKGLQELKSQVQNVGLLHEASERLSKVSSELVNAETFSRIAGIFSTTLGIITAVLFILLIGIYFAVSPELYQRGVEQLVTPRWRGYAREVLQELGHVVRWWLLGRLAALGVVGILTWIGLTLLGIPSAATLAFAAAVLSFIPNLGPILSVVPAALVGWSLSPSMALWVILLYLAIQFVESYLITPLIQQSNLQIPPVLLLSMQFLMSLMFGILGLLAAAPLTVVVLVLVRMLYIRKVLDAPIRLP